MRILILAVLFLFSSVMCGNSAAEIPANYQPLIERLSKDGFDPELLGRLFEDRRADIIPERMVVSLVSRENKELYAPFLTSESILFAKHFLRQNLKQLKEVERRFHVDKEVIVAILLVESRFGENTGKHRVLPTLASMAIMDSPENLQNNYSLLKQTDPELSYEWVEEKAKRRANWAYQELKCFLRIIRDETLDPLEVRGSYAGALGLPQFIPSSYLAFALRQKGFENWLLSQEEAILSIANYLKLNGWKKKIPAEKKRKVLWSYNRSEPYIETILQVADRIKPK
jgi:membrane-bound lytic murein transglycosylase B